MCSGVKWTPARIGCSQLAPRRQPAASEVVDAICAGAQVTAVFPSEGRLAERVFVVVEHSDGRECIAFEGAPSPGRNVTDMGSLDD